VAPDELGNRLLRRVFDAKVTTIHPATESAHHRYRGPYTLASISLVAEILGETVNMLAKESRAMASYDTPVGKEILQGRKTMVTGAKRTVPLLAEVIQERLDQGNINLLDLQPFQRDFPNVTAKPQKERKHITICLDGVRAGVPLRNQVMRQESRYMNGQLGRLHASALPGITSPKAASTRLITSGKSSAVKWRYRCVPDTFWCPR
jgi:hypothetical protein